MVSSVKNSIQRLPEKIINQIAAGELIERPACVVRELLDNAVDAGASEITLSVNYSEAPELTVKDNGRGIVPEELRLAFQQHTTSKINRVADLASLNTLGFRGEALASVASVSEIKVLTAVAEDGMGTFMWLRGGKEVEFRQQPAPKGTTITVSRLFFNAPVRKKFLKSVRFEKREIKSQCIKHVLANPQLGFSLFSSYRAYNEKATPDLLIPTEYDLKARILSLFRVSAVDLKKHLIPIEVEQSPFVLRGYCTDQSVRLGNRQSQFLILKKRVVRSAVFYKAVEEAYKHLLPSRSYPMCFFSVETEENFVDFNIHPAKKEVKFKDNSAFYSFVYHALKNNLLSKILERQRQAAPAWQPHFMRRFSEEQKEQARGDQPLLRTQASTTKTVSKEAAVEKAQEILARLRDAPPTAPSLSPPRSSTVEAPSAPPATPTALAEFSLPLPEKQPIPLELELKVWGQLRRVYILFSIGDSLYLTDQHAAHERINYDRLQKKIFHQDLNFQILLNPLIFEKSLLDKEALLLKEQQDKLRRFGIEIEEFGRQALKVTKIPTYFKEAQAEKIIELIFSSLLENKNLAPTDFFRKTIADLACRMSIRAGEILSIKQMEDLIKTLYQKNYLHSCPHGRPFVKCISGRELDAFFDRGRHLNSEAGGEKSLTRWKRNVTL